MCRLLHYNVEEARRIVGAPAPAITRFAEEQSPEQRDRIFDELNTLAVVYRQPSSAFTNAAPVHKEVHCAPPYPYMLQLLCVTDISKLFLLAFCLPLLCVLSFVLVCSFVLTLLLWLCHNPLRRLFMNRPLLFRGSKVSLDACKFCK